MALAHRHIDGFTHGAARVVQPRRRVRQLHEVLEVLERRVTPAPVEVVHERRAVVRGEHGRVATDLHTASGVAAVLDVLRRCRRHQLTSEPAGEPDPRPLDVATGVPESFDRARVVADLDADLGEDRVGVVLQQLQPLGRDDLDRRQCPGEERFGCDGVTRSFPLPSGAAPRTTRRGLGHDASSVALDDPARLRRRRADR